MDGVPAEGSLRDCLGQRTTVHAAAGQSSEGGRDGPQLPERRQARILRQDGGADKLDWEQARWAPSDE